LNDTIQQDSKKGLNDLGRSNFTTDTEWIWSNVLT